MHSIKARQKAQNKNRKKVPTKKISVPKAEIEVIPQQQLLDNPLMVFSSMAGLMKDDFPEEDEKPKQQLSDDDSDDSDEDYGIPKIELDELNTNNPKKIRELENERQQKIEAIRSKKQWVKRKNRTTCGKCIVCADNVFSRCQTNFGYIMLAMIILSVFFMFYIKVNEEEFIIKGDNEEIDYYKILNLDKSVDQKQLKKGYRKAVLKWHPDRNRDCGQKCNDKMAEVTEAYIILANPETRAFHDRFGVRPPKHLIEIAKAKHGGRGNM
eukprot:gene4186-7496_t